MAKAVATKPKPKMAKSQRKSGFKPALKPQWERFISLYFANGFNGMAAARDAGYAEPYNAAAWTLLQKEAVQSEIKKRMDAEGISAERIIGAIAQIALGGDVADIEPYLNGEMTLKALRDSGVDTRLIKSVTRKVSHVKGDVKGTTKVVESVKIDMYDRQRALESLAKIKKLIDGAAAPPPAPGIRVDVLAVMNKMLDRLESSIPEDSDCLSAPVGRRLLEGQVIEAHDEEATDG
jgi:phage terminase small subunit